MDRDESITGLSKKLGVEFKDETLLELALTHRSFGKLNNERLEYLGDAVLGLIIAETLYHKFPHHAEGELTRLRAGLVRRETLANIARSLDIGSYLKLGIGEQKAGGWRRDSILSNAMEAIIGALYLDSSPEQCRKFVLTLYADLLSDESLENFSKDPKTELQEYLQARKQQLPVYKIIEETGEAHIREFTVACQINGRDQAVAQGKSKRSAEQSAAQRALALLLSAN